MNWQMFTLNYGRPNFKRPAGCKISTRMNKRSSKRPSMAMSTPNNQSFRNKDAHSDLIRRDSEHFSNPRRNKLSLMILLIQLTIFCSFVYASNSHFNQSFIQDQQNLVVFKEMGLMFNPSNLNDAWWENNTILAESVTDYLNSEHRSNPRPLNEAQTLFKNLPSVELSNLEAALFITKTLRNIQYQGNKLTKQINWMKRSLALGLFGSFGTIH